MEQHKQIFEKVFLGTVQTYKNTLANYYPSFDSIGFTERNLTFNFSHNYLCFNPKAKIWQEVPIKNENVGGKHNEHFDTLIIDEINELIIIIEAKRLNSSVQFNAIKDDFNRMLNKHHLVNDFDKMKSFKKYGILLSDIWIPKDNDKTSKKSDLKDKFKLFEANKRFEFYFKIIDVDISEKENYHLICSTFDLDKIKEM